MEKEDLNVIMLDQKLSCFYKPKKSFLSLKRKLKRQSIYIKYLGRCFYCSKQVSFTDMTIDHIVAKANGGGNNLCNLALSCLKCNADKKDLSLTEFKQTINK
jgi:5-methylcytosine-specific restriction endonuclease McrA